MDLVAFGWGRLRARGGAQRRGTAQLLRAAEMRVIKSGATPLAQLPAGGGGGLLFWGGGGGGAPRRKKRPYRVGRNLGTRRRRPGVVVSRSSQGGERVSIPPSRTCRPHPHPPAPPVNQEVRFGAFRGSGVVGPQGRGGRAPSALGGWGGRAPAGCRGARGWEGLGGGAGPAEPGG